MLINRVKDYRKGAGLTQEDLALLAGVSRQTIISIEKNKFVPGLDIAIRISESLKTPINKPLFSEGLYRLNGGNVSESNRPLTYANQRL